MTPKITLLIAIIGSTFAGHAQKNTLQKHAELKGTAKTISATELTGITVYKDADYKGESKKYTVDVPQVGNDWNDVISSIRIPHGYKVTLYKEANFQGASLILSADWTVNDATLGWDDQVSSIRVVKIIDTHGGN